MKYVNISIADTTSLITIIIIIIVESAILKKHIVFNTQDIKYVN